MTEQELNSIKQLLGSPDSVNRELGIVLALNNGMSLEELVDKCYNKGWYYIDNKGRYDIKLLNDYSIGNYLIEGYIEGAELNTIKYVKIKTSDHYNIFKSMIICFIQDNYPELLNKIK